MVDRANAGNAYPIDPRFGGGMNAGRGLPPVRARKGTAPSYNLHRTGTKEDYALERNSRTHAEAMGFKNMAGDKKLQEMAKNAVKLAITDTYNVMENLRNKWLTLYRLYRGDTLSQVVSGEIALHEPEPFKSVETVHPRLKRALFQQMPNFLLRGHEWEDDEPAKNQTSLITDQLHEIRYEKTADLLLREMLIYGTCIQKTFWDQQYRNVNYQRVQRVPVPNRPGYSENKVTQVKDEERLVFNGNKSMPVSIFDVFAPPTMNPSEAPWMANQSLWPSYEVMKMGESNLWKNLSEMQGSPGGEVTTLDDEFRERKFYSAGVYDTR